MDSAAKHTFDAFDEADKLQQFRQKYTNTDWRLRTFEVDGLLLERFFLKTLINITVGGEYSFRDPSTTPGVPPIDLVQIAFGRKAFSPPEGLHVAAHVGQQNKVRTGLHYTALTLQKAVVAARFQFAGLHFFLSLYPHESLKQDGKSELMRHLKTCNYSFNRSKIASKQSHRIRFNW